MVDYEGLFIDSEELEKLFKNEGTFLGNRNDLPHITFLYKPDGKHLIEDVIGKSITCYLTAYGCDGDNSAFQVSLPDDYNDLYLNKDENGDVIEPHITVSLSDNGKAINSRYLTYVKLKEPIPVNGTFGYWIKDSGKEYPLFSKILPKKKEQ